MADLAIRHAKQRPGGRPVLLIVEDDSAVVRAMRRLIAGQAHVVDVGTIAEAVGALAMPVRLGGVVVDIGLPDGSGLDVLKRIRDDDGALPVLVLTGKHDPVVINAAHALRAEYVSKPNFTSNLRSFVERILEGEGQRGGLRMERVHKLSELAERVQLNGGEVEVLSASLDGVPRSYLAQHLGLSENTIKSRIRSLLVKTGHTSLAAVQYRLL